MNLLILGATGGTGRAQVEQALEHGHTVTAFAREPSKVRTTHPNLRVVKGDILDYGSVEAALQGQDAALSALGIAVKTLPIIAIVIFCQVIARLGHLIGPVGWLVRTAGHSLPFSFSTDGQPRCLKARRIPYVRWKNWE